MAAEARKKSPRGKANAQSSVELSVVRVDPLAYASPLKILAKLPCSVLVVDHEGTICLASREAALAAGTNAHTLEGRNISEFLLPLHELIDRSQVSSEVCALLHVADGRKVRVGCSLSSVHEITYTSQALYAVVFRDLRHETSVSEERDRLLRLASLGAAAPTILHEVKNSLSALSMGLELIANRCTDDSSRTNARALLCEARHVSQTLEGFGAVGRDLKTGEALDVEGMLADSRRVLQPRALRERVRLEWAVEPLPALHLDPAVLHAIVLNLVTNALGACEDGDSVTVQAGLDGDDFVLSVTDTGHGMSEEVALRCKELFFTTRRQGNGIGLALCNEAVLSAGGDLDIETEVGQGTRIVLRVPEVRPVRDDCSSTSH